MELLLNNDPEPFLCLNMIVKNESHIIKDTLTKLLKKVKFDYWVISDTGSTDNTKELITNFFKEHGIPGEIFDDEWKDFGHNRTKALEHAFYKSKYLFVFDADDEICGNFKLPELTKDSYHLQFGDENGTSYTRTQIVNNKKKWKYVGVLHEIITSIEETNGMDIITGDYYTVSGKSGDRSRDRNKYLKDALILEKAYEEALKNNDELYNRYGFYCANSYYDSGKHEDAIKWYKKTLENQNWCQEKYISCLRIYNCYNALKKQEEGFFYLVKSIEYDKERSECLYELISYYCINNLNEIAYGYYTTIKRFYNEQFLNIGLCDKLFLDCSKSNFYLPYYMILVADKVQDHDTVIQMYKIIFTKKHKEYSKFFIGNMLYNLQFFIERVKDDNEFKALFKDYVDFLISINYPIYDHEFMIKYEKYGINVSKFIESSFSLEECSKSKKILVYSGYSPFRWNHSFSINNALGGSETAISCLSNFFPKDYEIYVAGEVEEEKFDNITYVNSHNLKNLIKTNAFHTIIVSRYLHFYEIYKNFSAYQTFIWGHDISLYEYGTDMSVENILTKWSKKITGCICQTEWHKNHFISLYPQLKDKITIINNGINTELFTFKNKKVSNKFIYTSCSERGLKKLTDLWPTILENLPDAELTISSYNNFPKSEEDNKILEYIQKTPSITHIGKLNRTELYDFMSSAEYWLYPSYFQETSCITSLELLASEVICLYYPVAGLVNTIGDYGIPISEGNEIDKLLNLSMKQKTELKKRGKEYALNCSWKNRADEWCNMIFSKEKQEKQEKMNKSPIEKNNIKVINLKKREDRKKSMIEQFERENITNYEFIEAVDGSELKESQELRLLFEGNNFNYRKGVIGCALSHLNIYNRLINDDNNDYYVILEDDLDLCNDFKEKLEIHCKLFEEEQLEHLSLGVFDCNHLDQEKIKTIEITIFQKDVYNFWNVAFAYIISKNAARKMISYINNCSIKCAIDNPLSHGEVIKYSHTTHCITKQKNINDVGSDIQNNYNNLEFTSNTDNNQNNLKIAYCDWWYEEYCGGSFDFNNNFITDILRKYGNIGEIIIVDPNNEKPDVLFYSIFGNEHTKYTNIRKVFFSGEPFGIRAEADFNFTFDRNSDKNTRFPLWLGYLNDYLFEECQRRKNGIINVPKRENFCSFIANGEVKTTHRRTIVEKLSKYKKVHCGGNYLNNIGFNVPRGVNCSGKIEHNNKYKFAIAFENEDYPGYVTEKICDIFKSNCVPIYWGTKEVVNDFNPKTFINARDFENFDELVEYIIKVDNDDELYASFFKEPMFSNKWLDAFNDPNKTFYKNLAHCIIGKNKNLYDNYLTLKNNNINTALIIEPRDDDNLIHVILDFNKKLNKNTHNWQIVFYCGKNLKTKWMSVFKDINIEIRELDTNNLTQNTYSDFCKNKELWESLYGEFVLVFQLDTIIRNEDPYTIDYFINLNKSYIGGNMYYNWHELTRENINVNIKNFNGGLSLRKRLDMIKIIDTFNSENTIRPSYKIQTDAEDVYFTIGCYRLNLEIGDDEASSFFAVHSIIKEQFFGCHNPCPEIKQDLLNIYPPAIKYKTCFRNIIEYNIEKIKDKFNYECNEISDINEHLTTLYNYAKDCESIIECGVRGCISSWALAYGLIDNNKDKKNILLNDIEPCNIDDFLNITQNTPLDVSYYWCSDLDLEVNESVDMTFIDTLHVYGQLKRELEKFSKVTNKYIIMHDTIVDGIYGECIRHNWNASELSLKTGFPIEEINKGLQPAIDEFLRNNSDWFLDKKYINNNGLTILKKNKYLQTNKTINKKLCFDIGANIGEWSLKNNNIKIFNIWHNKLFDKCYKDLDEYSLNKITMYDVNQKYQKVYNKEKKYNIVREYELPQYNSLYQDTNYCQTSCLYHVFKNKLYDNTNYIGFIQYDMELANDFIYDMEQKINQIENDVYFYSLAVANKIEVTYICKPYNNSILEKYNNYFNTNHTYETIKADKKSDKFICLHTFVIPTITFIKMMTWYCTITDWLHTNYINGIYSESMSEITEEIFGLFLLLQMIENDSIKLEVLKLNHDWPNLHKETCFNNYKNQLHYFSLDKIVDNRFTDKNTQHSYLETYEKILNDKHLSCRNVLEIGIQSGGSMKLWNDYFVNANIYGIDIDENPHFLNEFKRVNCLKMNAYSQESIDYFSNKNIKFDLIIDDGPHTLESMTYFIKNYIQLLSFDGIMIVEDIQDIQWCDIFRTYIPNGYTYEIFDLRHIKNRWDDIMFVIKKCKLCFDIGANIGEWSLKNINNYDKIIAVESSENTFNKLYKNINGNIKIIPLNYAVCDSIEEHIKFYNCESDVLSTINNKWLNGGISRFNVKYEETLCKTISIDKLVELYGVPDLIKIDVESAEYECIKSMTKKYNCLCFEWVSEFLDVIFNCLNYLYKLGYRNFYIQMNNDEYTFRPNEYYTIERIKELLSKTTPQYECGIIWCE